MAELADRIPGELILASYANDIRDRAVMRYANAAARDASVPLPNPGDLAYLGDTERVTYFGTIWHELISSEGGQVIGGTLDVTGNFTVGDVGADATRSILWARSAKTAEIKAANSGFSAWIFNYADAEDGNTMRFQVNDADYVRLGVQGSIPLWRQYVPIRMQEWLGLDYQGTGLSGTNYALTFHHQGGTTAYGQIIQNQVAMMLDSTGVSLSLPTTTGGKSVQYNDVGGITIAGALSPNGDFFPLRFSTTSSERNKSVLKTAMPRSDPHHPIHLLGVEFKQWRYSDDYLPADDERAGEKFWAPTAETFEAAMPFAVNHDAEGRPESPNDLVVQGALLWLIQDLRKDVNILLGR
jgi:hypothetical protein